MDIDAFILIGGRSERFGPDKAFVEFEGETLAVRAARIVESSLSPARLTFVASAQDQFATELLFGLNKPIVADLRPGFGAWSGLHTALAYSQSEWTFVLACDLPFVSKEGLRAIATKLSSDTNAVIPRQADGRLQPLCAFYRAAAVRPVVDEMLTVDRSLPALGAMAELVSTRIVEADEFAALSGSDDFFHNVNTPADVTEFK